MSRMKSTMCHFLENSKDFGSNFQQSTNFVILVVNLYLFHKLLKSIANLQEILNKLNALFINPSLRKIFSSSIYSSVCQVINCMKGNADKRPCNFCIQTSNEPVIKFSEFTEIQNLIYRLKTSVK